MSRCRSDETLYLQLKFYGLMSMSLFVPLLELESIKESGRFPGVKPLSWPAAFRAECRIPAPEDVLPCLVERLKRGY
jgi:hypothetical protein